MNPIEFDYGLKSGQYVPIFKDESFKLKESKDLDWVSDTTNKVQTTGVDHDGNIISLQKVYFDFATQG